MTTRDEQIGHIRSMLSEAENCYADTLIMLEPHCDAELWRRFKGVIVEKLVRLAYQGYFLTLVRECLEDAKNT